MRMRLLGSLALSAAFAACLAGCSSPSSAPAKVPDADAPTPAAAKEPTTTESTLPAPQRKPPAGMGNAIGQVLYNGKPVPNIEVRLCQDIGFINGCSGKTYGAKTNKDGFYIIDKVKPGEYALAVRVFSTNKIIYPTSGIMSAAKYEIKKDETYDVDAVNLWKTDLRLLSPISNAVVKTGSPKLTWKAYPGAANYKVSVRTKTNVGVLSDQETGEASITPEKPLLNGDYQWRVEAYNAEGTKIAETPTDAFFKVTGQAGSNTVELISPKQDASVAGANLTLQWKAHPQASEYKVYLKGVKAKESLLSFVSVNGTSYKLDQTLPAGTYFWSVDAYKDGEKLAGSAFTRFVVK